MFGIEPAPYVHFVQVQEPKITFDLHKIQQTYDNYTTNCHAGLTLVMGHPFNDEEFLKHIEQEQEAIKEVFKAFHMEDVLVLYDTRYQVHATLIELAAQHDKQRNDQQLLKEEELQISSKTDRPMNINYTVRWIKKTAPFDVEIGPNALKDEHQTHTLRITDTGQIVMKGRAKDRKLLADMRAEFENEAGIIHKYGKTDDEFFFVIGYLKPDPRVLDPLFRSELEKCIDTRRPHIQLAMKVDNVKMIMYTNYSLDKTACLWESKELKLLQDPGVPQDSLIDSVTEIIVKAKILDIQQKCGDVQTRTADPLNGQYPPNNDPALRPADEPQTGEGINKL